MEDEDILTPVRESHGAPNFHIILPSMTANDGQVWLNGKLLEKVRSVSVNANYREYTIVSLEIVAQSVTIEGVGNINLTEYGLKEKTCPSPIVSEPSSGN